MPMISFTHLRNIDFRVVPIILMLMVVSLVVISSQTSYSFSSPESSSSFFTPYVKNQIQWFLLGGLVFVVCTCIDYHKLREYTWILYLLMLVALIGLYFTAPIQNVRRWYRIPFINFSFQPSEYAKLIVVITLSWFLERRKILSQSLSTAFFSCIIVGIPFLLILKQPDLGTALVLFPITLAIFYFGDIHPLVLRIMSWSAVVVIGLVLLIFLGVVPYESVRPYATKVLKEYQFERLNPSTHHQKTALTAIGIGGVSGSGWQKGTFSRRGWLPAAHTDSVMPAFEEEFGFLGLILLLALFYSLIYFSFQVTASVKDSFGRLLSAGITVYLAMHVLINICMMCGFLPITGVPLILVSYGGSSVLSTMAALGVLQSIYSRRFVF
jgi:rod shape determining protein RodA